MRPPARDRGSVLLLMPAAMMVVIVLAAIAVDLSLVRVRHEQLESVASAAANDAANLLSIEQLRSATEPSELLVSIDPSRVRAIVEEAVAASELDDIRIVRADAVGDEVTVELSIDVEHLFGRALPGTPDSRRVGAASTARLLLGDQLIGNP